MSEDVVAYREPPCPSGTLVSQSFIKTIATTFNGLLVIDEAYVDFVSDATHDLTQFAVEAPMCCCCVP